MNKILFSLFFLISPIYLKSVVALDKTYCKCQSKVSNRIIGGNISRPNAFPWQISLGLLPDTPWAIKPEIFPVGNRKDLPNSLKTATHICGGAIISNNLILTAAHCVTNNDKGPKPISSLGVGYGNNHNLIDIYNHGRMAIKAIYPHPNYNVSSKDTVYDIAIVRLAENLNFDSESVSPACFLNENDNNQIKDYNQLTATGWGSINVMSFNYIMRVWEGYEASLQLKEATFKDISHSSSICKTNNKLICVGPLDALKVNESVCKGDSGGPLHYTLGGRKFIVGVTSFGSTKRLGPFKFQACAGEASYTRVQSSLKWLKDIAGDDICIFKQMDNNKVQLSN